MLIGIIILALNVLIVVGYCVYAVMKWKESRPTLHIDGVGIRFLPGADSTWQGMECTVKNIRGQVTSVYGKEFTDPFMQRLIIEIVPHDGTRVCPTTVVSESTGVIGSITSERMLPWSKIYHVAVILQRKGMLITSRSAIAHEIIEHILPIYRGEGANADHGRKDLLELTRAVNAACK